MAHSSAACASIHILSTMSTGALTRTHARDSDARRAQHAHVRGEGGSDGEGGELGVPPPDPRFALRAAGRCAGLQALRAHAPSDERRRPSRRAGLGRSRRKRRRRRAKSLSTRREANEARLRRMRTRVCGGTTIARASPRSRSCWICTDCTAQACMSGLRCNGLHTQHGWLLRFFHPCFHDMKAEDGFDPSRPCTQHSHEMPLDWRQLDIAQAR